MPRASLHVRDALAAAGLLASGHPQPSQPKPQPQPQLQPRSQLLYPQPPQSPRARTVAIWQMDGGVGHDKRFMYRPVMDTLVGGFTDLPEQVAAAIGPLQVVPGYGRAKLKASTGALVAGDIFLWIGPIGSELVPWAALAERGVRTVYYQTEPVNGNPASARTHQCWALCNPYAHQPSTALGHCLSGCALSRSQPHELWDFSWHNLDNCRPAQPPWLSSALVFTPCFYAGRCPRPWPPEGQMDFT